VAGFMYYLPGVEPQSVTPELLKKLGLEDAFRDLFGKWQPPHNVTVAPIIHGPDGKSGCYLYPIPVTGNLPRTHGYNPDTQEWEDHDGYWLGIDTENRPTPPELVRPTVVSGYEYRLGDDCDWICPVLRRPDGTPNVPQSWGRNSEGFVEKVLPQWEWAWKLSEKIWNVFIGVEEIETPECWEISSKLLSINYRLGEYEVTRLGLVTSENYDQIFKAAVEGDLWNEALAVSSEEKKSELSELTTVNSSNGSETQIADTNQAGPQSP